MHKISRRGLISATGAAVLLAISRARADHRVTVPFGGRRSVFGLTLSLSELSYDHFEDGSFDAWAELTARAGVREARVILSIRDVPRTVLLLGRPLRFVAHSNAGFTLEG